MHVNMLKSTLEFISTLHLSVALFFPLHGSSINLAIII
jgi:hypothetical protein